MASCSARTGSATPRAARKCAMRAERRARPSRRRRATSARKASNWQRSTRASPAPGPSTSSTPARLGAVRGQAVNLTLAANGKLTDARDGPHWDGTVTRLSNKGTPSVNLEPPPHGELCARPHRARRDAARRRGRGVLDLKSFAFEGGRIQSAGTLTNLCRCRGSSKSARARRGPNRRSGTDLVFDGDWNFSLGTTAIRPRPDHSGARATFRSTRRAASPRSASPTFRRAPFHQRQSPERDLSRAGEPVGVIDANVHTPLVARDGILTVADESPLTGAIDAAFRNCARRAACSARPICSAGRLALKLTIAGVVAKPNLSGMLTGDDLSATARRSGGVQLKDGVIRMALSENLVDLQQVEFHGASGTLRATGQGAARSGRTGSDGQHHRRQARAASRRPTGNCRSRRGASVANAGGGGGGGAGAALAINGKFTVDHAPRFRRRSRRRVSATMSWSCGRTAPLKGEDKNQQVVAATDKPVGPSRRAPTSTSIWARISAFAARGPISASRARSPR